MRFIFIIHFTGTMAARKASHPKAMLEAAMPQPIDLDHHLRTYRSLTPSQKDALVRLIIGNAEAARTEAVRRIFRGAAAWSATAVVRGLGILRPVGVAARHVAAAAWRSYLRRRDIRRASARLHAMDDRALKDIGLRRSEIDFVLSGAKDPTRLPRPPVRDPLAALRPMPSPRFRDARMVYRQDASGGRGLSAIR
jgi:uncharacterized protein YjiS (DUF1127 family)